MLSSYNEFSHFMSSRAPSFYSISQRYITWHHYYCLVLPMSECYLAATMCGCLVQSNLVTLGLGMDARKHLMRPILCTHCKSEKGGQWVRKWQGNRIVVSIVPRASRIGVHVKGKLVETGACCFGSTDNYYLVNLLVLHTNEELLFPGQALHYRRDRKGRGCPVGFYESM